jgi:hypothetical protein
LCESDGRYEDGDGNDGSFDQRVHGPTLLTKRQPRTTAATWLVLDLKGNYLVH